MTKKILENILAILVAIGLFGVGGMIFIRGNVVRKLLDAYIPCRVPIRYSLGELDQRFAISPENFLLVAAQAEQLWEQPAGRELFAYAPDSGEVTIDLVYDLRQEITRRLQSLGIAIGEDTAAYETLKAKYDSMRTAYEHWSVKVQERYIRYGAAQEELKSTIEYWNKRGGAPQNEYALLEKERRRLEGEYAEIQAESETLNSTADDINAVGRTLNRLADILNLKVERYNTIGAQQSEEFEEGVYARDERGARITIYQYDDEDKLFRVLAHEFGHALGLEHLDNPEAMMYRLNQSTGEYLTQDDVVALKQKCRIED